MLNRITVVRATSPLLCLLLVAVASGPGLARAVPAQLGMAVVDSLPLPPGEVRGFTWLDEDHLVVLVLIPDSLSATGRQQLPLIYQDRWGNVSRTEDFTDTLARGLAFDGKYLWCCGDEANGGSLLYKIEADTCYVVEAYATPGHSPCGTAWDGTYVWVADRDSGRLDRFDPKTGQVTRSVVTPGFSPYGTACDGRHTWVSDSGTGRLYRLIGARGRWNGTVVAEAFDHRGLDVLLSFHAGSLWYAPAGGSQVYQVRFP